MTTPSEHFAGLQVGTVEFVAPAEIRIVLELDAPHSTALNTGVPTGFPRVNGYILIPTECGALVGVVSWLGVERSPFPKRKGLKDFDLVDLPYPLRKMSVTPLGTLLRTHDGVNGQYTYYLERGIRTFPSVGDAAVLPSTEQLEAIVAPQGNDRRVQIGVSPLAHDTPVSIDPDKLFGRHFAVLGNTGSGKSCSVAGIIRWSLDAARGEEAGDQQSQSCANARFIVLDPNGEYRSAFSDNGERVRVFQVSPDKKSRAEPLRVPAWLWNSHEWCALAGAAPGAQRPLLLQALRELRAGRALEEPLHFRSARIAMGYRRRVEEILVQGLSGYTQFPGSKNFGTFLERLAEDAERYHSEYRTQSEELSASWGKAQQTASALAAQRRWKGSKSNGFDDFSENDVLQMRDTLDAILQHYPDTPEPGPRSEDAPIPFDVSQLTDHLEHVAAHEQSSQASQFVATLTMRIRSLLADTRKRPVLSPEKQPTLVEWLEDYIGKNDAGNGEVAVIDLSLVPSDVLATVVAVMARLTFEALQRYRRSTERILPTVLVLDEAHTFIQRTTGAWENVPTPNEMCREAFEKIAREGRKFGLGLVLASQRPSELSPTVLAQCNTFLLHRLVNDRDQDLVKRLIPDKLGGLLDDLPSLPTRHALLLGWATPLPVLVEMKELPEGHRPRSDDPDFWNVWVRKSVRTVDWDALSQSWTEEQEPT